MAVPANITYVTVTGRYVDASGAGMVGSVTFKPLADRILDTGVNTIVAITTVEAVLDDTGAFSVSLMAGNDTDVTPSGFSYTVTEQLSATVDGRFRNLTPVTYSVALTTSMSPTVTLTSLTPSAPAVAALTTYVKSVNTATGDVVVADRTLSNLTSATTARTNLGFISGSAVLSGGTVVVSNAGISATSRIMLTSQVDGGTPGWLRVSARTNGTSFTILSSSGTDTSTVGYVITAS